MTENAHRMQTRAATARRTRAASKRAALADAVQDCAPPAKKRRALGTLANNSHIAADSKATGASKPFESLAEETTRKGKVSQTVTEMPTQAGVGISGIQTRAATKSKLRRSSATGSSLLQSDENVPPNAVAARVRVDEKRPLRDITGLAIQSHAVVTGNLRQNSTQSSCMSLQHDFLVDDVDIPKYVNNIDNSHGDPQMCSIYASDIYHHLRIAEMKKRYVSNYMELIQKDINPNMRGILVDWLVEVAEEYKLVPDTLYLTVSYIDQYLSANSVTRQRLQLLGVSCMLIASKYEEICAPEVNEFCYITDNTYGKEEVLEMERKILKHLRFELSVPTIKTFLRRFIRAAQTEYKALSLQLEFLANYLAELTLVEYSFLKHSPSVTAASAVFLARLTVDPSTRPWTTTLQHYSGYRPSQLKACVKEIYDLQRNVKNCTLTGVREKYKQHKFKCVANMKSPSTLPIGYFKDDQPGELVCANRPASLQS